MPEKNRVLSAAAFLASVVFVCAGAAFLVRVTHDPDADPPRVAIDTVRIAAPPYVVWEEIIKTDSSAEYFAGVRYGKHAGEAEDAEHIKFALWRDSSVRVNGQPASRAVAGLHTFDLTSATWDLDSAGDNGTRLLLSTRYRASTWVNVANDWWAARVMRAQQERQLATVKSRSERVQREKLPVLTAEMRQLETSILDRTSEIADRHGMLPMAEALAINGERRVETFGGVSHRAGETLDEIESALRNVIAVNAPHTRTSALVSSHAAVGDTSAAGGDDELHFEFEDRHGRCVSERRTVSTKGGGTLVIGKPVLQRCEVRALAEAIRRGRLLARLPLHAGDLNDTWSLALAIRGRLEVYRDSVVARVDSLLLRSKAPDHTPVDLDSISFALGAKSGTSWYAVKRGSIFPLMRTLAMNENVTLTRVRFAVQIDSTFALKDAWPMFEASLSVPKTKDNPYGYAWTYAHTPMATFKSIAWPPGE